MNTNSNIYTVIFSIILVVIVAAVLAFAAMFLKPMQDANVKKDTKIGRASCRERV